ncbi:MAG: hypothetical protein HY826_00600 [Actinobacteria bacterium]|nr:hypothetical protein [Actinomycetota bacterium]
MFWSADRGEGVDLAGGEGVVDGGVGDGGEAVEEAAAGDEAVGVAVGHAGMVAEPGGDRYRPVECPFATGFQSAGGERQHCCPLFVFGQRCEQFGAAENNLFGHGVNIAHGG